MAGYHLTRGGIWVKQPQALIELDADNPICRGLVYVVNPASTNIAYSGSAVRVATPQGIAVQNTTGTTSAGLATGIKNIGGTLIAASTPRSALVVAYVNTFANAPYYYAGLRDSSGVESAYAALLWSNNATAIGLSWNNGFKYVTAPAAGNVIVSGSVPGSGLFASAFVCVNGEFPDTTATQDGTPPAQLNDATVNIAGRTTDSIRSLNGHVSLAAFWNRELSEREHISLYRNPYQIFKPQQRRIWVPVSAGGASIDLTVQDATHGHAADSPTLTTEWLLTVADAIHAHAVDSPALITDSILAVQDSTHGHAADNLDLNITGSTDLTVQDSAHAHAADSPTLTTEWLLTVADSAHAHAAEGLTLTLGADLIIADSSHAHTADNIGLTMDSTLVVGDGLHGHTVDLIVLDVAADVSLIYKLLANRQELNSTTAQFVIYDDDDSTVLLSAAAWADAAGTVPYSGGALKRIDRLS